MSSLSLPMVCPSNCLCLLQHIYDTAGGARNDHMLGVHCFKLAANSYLQNHILVVGQGQCSHRRVPRLLPCRMLRPSCYVCGPSRHLEVVHVQSLKPQRHGPGGHAQDEGGPGPSPRRSAASSPLSRGRTREYAL